MRHPMLRQKPRQKVVTANGCVVFVAMSMRATCPKNQIALSVRFAAWIKANSKKKKLPKNGYVVFVAIFMRATSPKNQILLNVHSAALIKQSLLNNRFSLSVKVGLESDKKIQTNIEGWLSVGADSQLFFVVMRIIIGLHGDFQTVYSDGLIAKLLVSR